MHRPRWLDIRGWFCRVPSGAQLEAALARLDAMQARLDHIEAGLADQAEWSAELRAELLAVANSLSVYRQDVEALLAGRPDQRGRAEGG